MSALGECRPGVQAPDLAAFADVQRIVLRGGHWQHARHLVLKLEPPAGGRCFLERLASADLAPTTGAGEPPPLQVSLGISRRGLEHLGVPRHVLAAFAAKAPAFHAGASLRAGRHLGATGDSGPGSWDPEFEHGTLDAVLSLHDDDAQQIDAVVVRVVTLAAASGLRVKVLERCDALPRPEVYGKALAGQGAQPRREQWMHFGYRDGLALVGIEGLPSPTGTPRQNFRLGEFVLGHAQNSGANPWLTMPASTRVWPEEFRAFFRDGSFGILHQLDQDVTRFEEYVVRAAGALRDAVAGRAKRTYGTDDGAAIDAATHHITADYVKALLCGRYPTGEPLIAPQAAPEDEFGYEEDSHGAKCPFGAHIRRMNPRPDLERADAAGLAPGQSGPRRAHFGRVRPLLRRGMPYGPPLKNDVPTDVRRGLMGHFFCASIEDQFEHLLGQWSERIPMGMPGRGVARDPLIGLHEAGDSLFTVLQPEPWPAIALPAMPRFVRTAGIAYLFYPSGSTLQGIAESRPWAATYESAR